MLARVAGGRLRAVDAIALLAPHGVPNPRLARLVRNQQFQRLIDAIDDVVLFGRLLMAVGDRRSTSTRPSMRLPRYPPKQRIVRCTTRGKKRPAPLSATQPVMTSIYMKLCINAPDAFSGPHLFRAPFVAVAAQLPPKAAIRPQSVLVWRLATRNR